MPFPKNVRKVEDVLSEQLSNLSGGKVGIIYSPKHLEHSHTQSSPENPERIQQIYNYIKSREELFKDKCDIFTDVKVASEKDILEVHNASYIDFIKKYCNSGGGFLGDSTYLCPKSYEVASYAVGGAIRAAELVLEGKYDFGYALVRPPGHHASSNSYGGFCILNNGAILARRLQKMGMKKIMFVDWDVHAGNGTMKIFYQDPTILKVSIHRSPKDFYPNEGFSNQIGEKEGLGFSVNLELPEGSGDNEYMLSFIEIVIPLYEQFKPDFVIGCCGFDAHHSEKYTKMNMTSEGLFAIVKSISRISKGKMVVLMEGGYNKNNAKLAHTIINALCGKTLPFEEKVNSLSSSYSKREKVHRLANENIASLKGHLKEYWKF